MIIPSYETALERFSEYWRKFVPDMGEADTEHGELLRAIGRLEYEYNNNGFGNIGDYYMQLTTYIIKRQPKLEPFLHKTHLDDPFRLLQAEMEDIYDKGVNLERYPYDSINHFLLERLFRELKYAIVRYTDQKVNKSCKEQYKH
jgi:hypothetical protein